MARHARDPNLLTTTVLIPRCAGSLRPCERCGAVPACPNGESRWCVDPLTGEAVWTIWYCSLD